MEKLIIENRTDLPMDKAIEFIQAVISAGKHSKTSKGHQYCFVTVFPGNIAVYADKNKNSDKLIVSRIP